jgi:hypothetical protein
VNDKEKHIIYNFFLPHKFEIFVNNFWTFSDCTKFFKQLFTVHGYKNGHYVPLVFAILTDKTAQSYEHCLQFVTSLCYVIICTYQNTYTGWGIVYAHARNRDF